VASPSFYVVLGRYSGLGSDRAVIGQREVVKLIRRRVRTTGLRLIGVIVDFTPRMAFIRLDGADISVDYAWTYGRHRAAHRRRSDRTVSRW
jgi:hypothetical protein